MPAFLAAMTAGISGFSSRGARKIAIDALRDHAVDVGDLLGGRAGGVGIDQLPAALLGFVLHGFGLGYAPGIVAFGLGEANLVGVLLGELWQFGKGGACNGSNCCASHEFQEIAAKHLIPPC